MIAEKACSVAQSNLPREAEIRSTSAGTGMPLDRLPRRRMRHLRRGRNRRERGLPPGALDGQFFGRAFHVRQSPLAIGQHEGEPTGMTGPPRLLDGRVERLLVEAFGQSGHRWGCHPARPAMPTPAVLVQTQGDSRGIHPRRSTVPDTSSRSRWDPRVASIAARTTAVTAAPSNPNSGRR